MNNKTYRRLLVLVLGMSTALSYAFVKNSAKLKSNVILTELANRYSDPTNAKPIYYNPDNLYAQYGDKPNNGDFFGFGISSMKLLNFNAVKHGNKVEIFWAATSSVNNDYFTLERSKNGINFSKVAIIDMATVTNNIMQYCETDYQPLKGVSYYRLKHTDLNNIKTYSNIIMVNYVFDESTRTTYSNRSMNSTLKSSLTNSKNTEVLVLLKDTDGAEFFSKVVVSVENSEIIGVDTQNKIAPGTYVVTATSNNALYSQKLTIKE